MTSSEWLLFLTGALTIIYLWIKHHFAYWRRQNIPSIEPNPIFGNLKDMAVMTSCSADLMVTLYNDKNAKDQPLVGIYIFTKPALLVRDPELIKSILIKDFNKFSNRFSACGPHDPLAWNSLFFIKNPYWKEVRTKVTPIFSSGKIRQMFPLIEEVGNQLDSYLCSLPLDPNTNSCIKEVKNISALYTTDVIASVAYGIQANSLNNPESEFQANGKAIFELTFKRALDFSVIFFLPHLGKLFSSKLFPSSVEKFIRDTINFAMTERLKSGTVRNDFIDVLLAFNKTAETEKANGQYVRNNDMMVAQAAAFFTAGYDTSSSAVAFAIYELCKHPELQKRLRQEIKEGLAKTGGRVTYEMVSEIEYLEMVIQEVLRLYPPLPFLDRECTLGKGETGFSLKPHSDFAVPNRMPVYIPIYGIHRDAKYFPNPDEFNPERFSPENKKNIVPCTYMPFGAGPHNCIGERLALIQAKIGVVNFLKNHFIDVCEKTPKKIELDPKGLLIQVKGGVYCKFVRDPLLS